MVGDVGAVDDEDVDEVICSSNTSRSLRRALDCFKA
jgi:hypothetical protein